MRVALAAIAFALVLSAPRVASAADLTGVWTNSSLTRLTRPQGMALVLSEAEARALASRQVQAVEADGQPTDPRAGAPPAGAVGGYNQFWMDDGDSYALVDGQRRASWIVEPASGQLPLNPAGQALMRQSAQRPGLPPDGPESLSPADRCLIGSRGSGGPAMLNNLYNNTYQIVQTPGAVAIEVEMMHDVRVVPLFPSRAAAQAGHAPTPLHRWLGDSVGWWEGETLVVETVNVHPEQGRNPPYLLSPRARVTERFRKSPDGRLRYDFAVDDPTYYTQAWRAELVFNPAKGPVYEYACHEGNYAIHGILAGARRAETAGR